MLNPITAFKSLSGHVNNYLNSHPVIILGIGASLGVSYSLNTLKRPPDGMSRWQIKIWSNVLPFLILGYFVIIDRASAEKHKRILTTTRKADACVTFMLAAAQNGMFYALDVRERKREEAVDQVFQQIRTDEFLPKGLPIEIWDIVFRYIPPKDYLNLVIISKPMLQWYLKKVIPIDMEMKYPIKSYKGELPSLRKQWAFLEKERPFSRMYPTPLLTSKENAENELTELRKQTERAFLIFIPPPKFLEKNGCYNKITTWAEELKSKDEGLINDGKIAKQWYEESAAKEKPHWIIAVMRDRSLKLPESFRPATPHEYLMWQFFDLAGTTMTFQDDQNRNFGILPHIMDHRISACVSQEESHEMFDKNNFTTEPVWVKEV